MRKPIFILIQITGLTLGLFAQPAFANSIPFYLPLSSEQFPTISDDLENALHEAGLSQFKVTTTDYWHPYQQGLRRGRRGVYFAAPHFSAWAIDKYKFVPILRLRNKLQYVIVARRTDSHIFEVNDLAGKTVCTGQAPNLDFLLSRTALRKAVILARTKPVKSVPQAMRSDDQNCQAFSVSRHIFDAFIKTEPFRFIRLQQSDATLNYGFIVNRQTALDHGIKLRKFLRSARAKSVLKPMYDLYSDKTILVGAKTRDYSSNDYAPLLDYWD